MSHDLWMLLRHLSREEFLLVVACASAAASLVAGGFGAWLAAYVGGRGAAKRAVRRAFAMQEQVRGQGSAANDARLAALVGAVDAMALEVERISEGQRFLVKVLSEQEASHLQMPRLHAPGSVTPH
jgi:hypothetical protein